MAKLHQRVFALVAALLFLGTSVGFSALVAWQIFSDDKPASSAETANNLPANQLQGTKLANFAPIDKVESLQSTDVVAGTGDEAKADSKVTVNYTGALAKDGTIFESSLDSGQPATFGVNEVIEGWKQGVPGMKVGGTRRLVIPAALAYGDQARTSIPANSDLVFDIELLQITN